MNDFEKFKEDLLYYYEYISNSSERCVVEVDLEYPKELQQLHNNYPLAPDKIEIKRETLCID